MDFSTLMKSAIAETKKRNYKSHIKIVNNFSNDKTLKEIELYGNACSECSEQVLKNTTKLKIY